MADPVISVRQLTKSYADTQAVRGIDLEVHAGEVFAFLGPNGAGKTTTVEILEGYRQRSGGEVRVLGVDPAHPNRAWRERIGLVLQDGKLQRELTVAETLTQYAGYYSKARPVPETITLVGLDDAADTRARRLSGGQQRRLEVGCALIGDPDLLFLDEPTTGFDPAARRGAWELIGGLRDLGKTVFLTTHYMDEAQALADRIAIIAAGQIVAEGPPDEIGGRATAATRIRFRLAAGVRPTGLAAILRRTKPTPDGEYVVTVDEPTRMLHALTGWALDRGVDLLDLRVERPSLEDVYLALTDVPA